ncbi:MAG: NAD(P)/FAD-dependent oxidoreductase [Eubacteriales bacterium]
MTIIHRRDAFRASKASSSPRRARKHEVILNENVTELSETDNKLSSITLTSGKVIPVDGLFVAIGLEPDSTLFKGQIQTTENGYIVTDDMMRTSLKNVYAAGDIREKSLRQIVTAAADGAIAAVTAADEIQ